MEETIKKQNDLRIAWMAAFEILSYKRYSLFDRFIDYSLYKDVKIEDDIMNNIDDYVIDVVLKREESDEEGLIIKRVPAVEILVNKKYELLHDCKDAKIENEAEYDFFHCILEIVLKKA